MGTQQQLREKFRQQLDDLPFDLSEDNQSQMRVKAQQELDPESEAEAAAERVAEAFEKSLSAGLKRDFHA